LAGDHFDNVVCRRSQTKVHDVLKAWGIRSIQKNNTTQRRSAMKTKKSVSKMLAVVALLALSVPVPAFSEMKNMEMDKMDKMDKMGMCSEHADKMDDMMGMCVEHADKMGLTDEQSMKIKPLHREMQKELARFKADLKIAEIEHLEIMEVKDFDLEKANSAVKKIAAIKTAHQLEMLKAMKEMRSVLTDEQFKKMMKMMPMKTDDKKAIKKIINKHH
jgi:Spy/CpxP family protein refolding chaperone